MPRIDVNKDDHAEEIEEHVTAFRDRSRGSRSGSVSFAHPITTRMIDDTGENYIETVKWAILRGISQVLMSITVMSTSIYSIHKAKLHGALFSIAYHFFVAQAILSLSYINGWSTPMRRRHRRLAHAFLQLCALCSSGYGVLIIMTEEELPNWKNIHGISGLMTLVLTGMNWAISPFVVRRIHGASVIHMLCGIFCFLMSSLCLGSGVASTPFTKWAGLTIVPMLFVFIAFYSIFMACILYKKWAQ